MKKGLSETGLTQMRGKRRAKQRERTAEKILKERKEREQQTKKMKERAERRLN